MSWHAWCCWKRLDIFGEKHEEMETSVNFEWIGFIRDWRQQRYSPRRKYVPIDLCYLYDSFVTSFKKSEGLVWIFCVWKELILNHLLFKDDLKLYGRSNVQTDSLVQAVFTCSEDIGMELGLKKCGVTTLKKEKLVMFDEIYLPRQEIMQEVDRNGCAYHGIFRVGWDKRTRNEE